MDITPAQFKKFFTSIKENSTKHSCIWYSLKWKILFLFPVSIPEIYNVCIGLWNSQAVDTDGLNNLFVKFFSPIICKLLLSPFNKSMSKRFYPNFFKIAKIIPVFKAGDRQNPTNFQPISILSSLNKIFEKILLKDIMDFLLTTNQITEQQFGFQPKKSTNQALVEKNVERIRRLLDSNMNVLGLFLDASKAFDTVDHWILVKKLKNYGIRGIALLFIERYLQKRKQYV